MEKKGDNLFINCTTDQCNWCEQSLLLGRTVKDQNEIKKIDQERSFMLKAG